MTRSEPSWRRRLKVTRAGAVVIALALGAGLAALNTGNNPLFLAWGMVLGAILVSGILSEAVLRPLAVTLYPPDEVRARVTGHLRVRLHNKATRVPALAIEVFAQWEHPTAAAVTTYAPYQLRLDPQQSRELFLPFTPPARGAWSLRGLGVRTAYPFGFFVKERPLPVPELVLWAAPAPSAQQPDLTALLAQRGREPAGTAGEGEDFFALRAYRVGDPLKHVQWRRVAKTGRWLVAEREAQHDRRIMLVLTPDPAAPPALFEAALSSLATLVEQALLQGFALGLVAPDLVLAPQADVSGAGRQRRALMHAFARMEAQAGAAPARAPSGRDTPHLVVAAPGLLSPGLGPATLQLRTEAAS